MKVVIAPDSFKGTITNVEAAAAIAEGWLSVRPADQVISLPMADGGEGTLETIALKNSGAIHIAAPIAHPATWLLLPDGTAIVELASICGITLLTALDAMNSSTYDLGVVLKEVALDPRVNRIVITVGGSASTDGGVGALIALGAQCLDSEENSIRLGGVGLSSLSTIDISHVVPAPKGGVVCLVDVTNPLWGPQGSAPIFAPQKGANADQVRQLEVGLKRLQEVSGHADFPGAGAAGGTPFGLSVAWEIALQSGALTVASLIGLPEAIIDCDLIITGEGRLDSQSAQGKVVGTITELATAHHRKVRYCVGSSEEPLGKRGIALVDIAPSSEAAMSHPREWLSNAGAELARRENT